MFALSWISYFSAFWSYLLLVVQ